VRTLARLVPVAFLAVAAAPARPAATEQWSVSISGRQTLQWSHTSTFDAKAGRPPATCSVRHRGTQLLRFGTPGAVPVELARTDAVTDAAYSDIRGRKRRYVPLTGSETRAHVVVASRSSGCRKPIEVEAIRNCRGKKPLVARTGVVLTARTRGGATRVEIHVPVSLGFQPRFLDCDLTEFDQRHYFESAIGTGTPSANHYVAARGGSIRDPAARRLTVDGSGVGCLDERFPRVARFTSCDGPHAAKLSITWRITLRRLGA
jgi:hypothetical protein